MDIAQLKAAAEAGRRFTHEIDGRKFQLVTPTQFAANLIAEENKAFSRTQRGLVLDALRGWTNVTTWDLGLPHDAVPSEPLPYTAETAELLLDERPDWEVLLCDVVAARVQERRKRFEELAGN